MDQPVLDALNSSLQSILLVVIPIVTVLVVRYIKGAWAKAQWPEQIVSLSRIAVQAAEQMHLAELIQEKKPYALGVLQNLLDSHQIKLNAVKLEAAIEAAVYEANRYQEFEHQVDYAPIPQNPT